VPSFIDDLRSARLRDLGTAVADGTISQAHVVASAAVFRSHRIVTTRVEQTLAPLGLTAPRFETLALVATAKDGRMTFLELKRALLQHAATLTYTVDQLEKAGLILRCRSPEDRRAVIAEITPAGRELAAQATSALDEMQFGLAGMASEDAEQVAVLLSMLDDDDGLAGVTPAGQSERSAL
jgi:DNA-binding MarR family transcriptional regulator